MVDLFTIGDDPDYDPFAEIPDAPRTKSKPAAGFRRFEYVPASSLDTGRSKKSSTSRDSAYREKLAIAWLESQGYIAYKISCYAVTHSGMQFKRDFLGFGDLIAFHGERGTAIVQVTTINDMNSHLREMASPTLIKQQRINPRNEIERLLGIGVKVLLVGYQKGPNGRYMEPRIIDVDAAVLAAVDARRRK